MEIKLPKAKPKGNTFHESDFQSLVTAYLKKEAFDSFPYELKVSTGNTVNFNSFEAQQIPALMRAKQSVLHHKMNDASLGSKPCDGFCYRKSRAYVGLMFNTKTNRNICYFLDVAVAVMLKKMGYKSISERAAGVLGITITL